jgi:hypothetical protein
MDMDNREEEEPSISNNNIITTTSSSSHSNNNTTNNEIDLPKFSPLRYEMGEAETGDHMDHTFCGIMFNLVIKDEIPVEQVLLQSIAVRGALGRMSVYICVGGFQGKELIQTNWQRVYGPTHCLPSVHTFQDLELLDGKGFPVKMGDVLGIYVHSERPDDAAIVYDNVRTRITFENDMIRILPGLAHLSNIPFSNDFPWAWRSKRAFVGRIKYAVVRLLWRPQVHAQFPVIFKSGVHALLLCHLRFPLSQIPHAVLLKIINYLDHSAFAKDRNNTSRRSFVNNDSSISKRGKILAAKILSKSVRLINNTSSSLLLSPTNNNSNTVEDAAHNQQQQQQGDENNGVEAGDGPTCTMM